MRPLDRQWENLPENPFTDAHHDLGGRNQQDKEDFQRPGASFQ
jgi:hypothetical protein